MYLYRELCNCFLCGQDICCCSYSGLCCIWINFNNTSCRPTYPLSDFKKSKMNDIPYASFKFYHYQTLTLRMCSLIGKYLSQFEDTLCSSYYQRNQCGIAKITPLPADSQCRQTRGGGPCRGFLIVITSNVISVPWLFPWPLLLSMSVTVSATVLVACNSDSQVAHETACVFGGICCVLFEN